MWHYAEDGNAVGPIGEEQIQTLIREGRIRASTLVWKQGMTDWRTAAEAGLVTESPPVARLAPPPPAPLPPPMPGPAAGRSDDKTLGALAHILALFTGFLGPLIILLAAQDANAKAHARRALNWQISLIIWFIVCIPLSFLLIGVPLILVVS